MEQFGNNAVTTLNGSITSGATSLIVTSATNFPTSGSFRILVDSGVNLEYMLVTAVSGTTFTVTRAQEGTTGIAHNTGVQVIQVVTAGALSSVRGDWQTFLDLDFTAQTTQTLSPDGNYTIGGFTFKKENSANDASAMVLTNGTGIVTTPVQATDLVNGTRSGPLLFFALSQLNVPNLDWMNAIRVWLYVSASNPQNNFDNAFLAFGTDDTNWYYAALRGENSGVGLWLRRTINSSSNATGVYGTSLTGAAQVMSIQVRSLYGGEYHGNLTTGTPLPWPTVVRPMNAYYDGTGSATDGFAGNALSPGNMGIWFGCMRGNGGTTGFASTFARLRIDIRY